jgi:predicted  nucleic acid-binding Zn-ribbon protein
MEDPPAPDSDAESADSELEETLPICVQGDLTRLRRDNSELKKAKKALETQLERSQLWAGELEKEVGQLKSRIEQLGEQLKGEVTNCDQCEQLKLQLDEMGERFAAGQSSLEGECQATQTDEVDSKHAAWLWQCEEQDQRGETWEVRSREHQIYRQMLWQSSLTSSPLPASNTRQDL